MEYHSILRRLNKKKVNIVPDSKFIFLSKKVINYFDKTVVKNREFPKCNQLILIKVKRE